MSRVLLRLFLLIQFSLLLTGLEAGKKTSQRRACRSTCRTVKCVRKCANAHKVESRATNNNIVTRTSEHDDCSPGVDGYLVAKVRAPQCSGFVYNRDCIVRRAVSTSVDIAAPPSDLRLAFLSDHFPEIVGRLSWVNPSEGHFEGIQIRIYKSDAYDSVQLTCLEINITHSNMVTSCELNSTFVMWDYETQYDVYINSIPTPSNCSKLSIGDFHVESPGGPSACKEKIDKETELYPAPAKPVVTPVVSRGEKHVNLSISWKASNLCLPVIKSQIIIQNNTYGSEPLKKEYVGGNATSFVLPFVPIVNVRIFWITVRVYTDPTRTEKRGVGEGASLSVLVPPEPTLLLPTEGKSLTQQAHTTNGVSVTSQPTTQELKPPKSQRDDTTSSIIIAGGVSGACALVSVIIVVGSLIYCRKVSRRSSEFTVKRTAEDEASVPRGTFCAHTDRRELVRIVEEVRRTQNRSFNRCSPGAISDSSSLSFHSGTATNHQHLSENSPVVTTVEVHGKVDEFGCDWFKRDHVSGPRVLFVYSTSSNGSVRECSESVRECRRMVAMMRSEIGINAISHEFDEEEARRNIPNWVNQHMQRADFIVFVCSQQLNEDFNSRHDRGPGDCQVVRSICHFTEGFYTDRRAEATAKCIPVILTQQEQDCVPHLMTAQRIYCWATEKEQIIRLLSQR